MSIPALLLLAVFAWGVLDVVVFVVVFLLVRRWRHAERPCCDARHEYLEARIRSLQEELKAAPRPRTFGEALRRQAAIRGAALGREMKPPRGVV